MSTIPPLVTPGDGVTAPHLDIELRLTQWSLVLVCVVVLASSALFVWALLRSARFPAPIALVVALSVLSLVSIGSGLLTGNGDFITLAATGIGALAGAVSATYRETRVPETEPKTTKTPTPSEEDVGV